MGLIEYMFGIVGHTDKTSFQKTSSFDRHKLRTTLSNMETISIIGRYGVDEYRKQIKCFPVIIQWQGGQKNDCLAD